MRRRKGQDGKISETRTSQPSVKISQEGRDCQVEVRPVDETVHPFVAHPMVGKRAFHGVINGVLSNSLRGWYFHSPFPGLTEAGIRSLTRGRDNCSIWDRDWKVANISLFP